MISRRLDRTSVRPERSLRTTMSQSGGLVLITFDRLDCFHMEPGRQLNNLCTLVQRGFGYRSPSDEGVIPP